MIIKINGIESEVSDAVSIQNLLSTRNLSDKKTVVIELNGTIIHSKSYDSTKINHGDRLEIIHIIGGG